MKHTSYPILCAAAIAGLSPMSLQGETPSPSVQPSALGELLTRNIATLHQAAEQGDANAQFRLGISYRAGLGVAKDEQEAVKWYRKAAEQGHAEAQMSLGLCYVLGTGVEEDGKEAMKWFRIAAEQGHAQAQYCLGLGYEQGTGVAKDRQKAAKWYRKAAAQGNKDAIERLRALGE